MKNFKNKVVVITGSGIGRALSLKFATMGAKLALNDYQDSGLKESA